MNGSRNRVSSHVYKLNQQSQSIHLRLKGKGNMEKKANIMGEIQGSVEASLFGYGDGKDWYGISKEKMKREGLVIPTDADDKEMYEFFKKHADEIERDYMKGVPTWNAKTGELVTKKEDEK